MKEKKKYTQPDTGVVALHDRLMLELPISDGFVDEEAAKQQNIDFGDNDVWGDIWTADDAD